MILFAGLGNPGRTYVRHRHNVGYMAVEHIATRFGFPAWSRKFQGLASNGRIDGVRVVLLKPETMMNESGRSVSEAQRFFRIEPKNVVVFHDEIDLAPGKCRVKAGGGTAGHNGLRSIDSHLGKDFRRVRIGIGHPGHKSRVTSHVLGNFSTSDAAWLDPLLDAVAKAAPFIVSGDDNAFMNECARIRRAAETLAGHADNESPRRRQSDAPEASSLLRQLLNRLRN